MGWTDDIDGWKRVYVPRMISSDGSLRCDCGQGRSDDGGERSDVCTMFWPTRTRTGVGRTKSDVATD